MAGKKKRTAHREPALGLERAACHDLATSLAREWLETDGRGGYASLTVPFCPTRRQHGLLVAPYPGNPRRHVFLSRYEETLEVRGREFPLSVGRYAGLWSPHGHQSLVRFDARPWPRSVHRIGEVELTREVLMAEGESAVLVRWRAQGASRPVSLALRLLAPFREADALTVENAALNPRTGLLDRGIRCRPYPEMPTLSVTVGGAPWQWRADPCWYRRVEYAVDIARGYDGHEDVFSPGVLVLDLAPGAEAVVAATVGAAVTDPARSFAVRAAARQAAWDASPEGLEGLLAYGADRYVARGLDRKPWVVAGFPWFSGWGRDTFIAVPGLFFARGLVEEGGDVLEAAVPHLRDGVMPNRFGATPVESEYGSADAALWFVRAVRLYERAGGSKARLRERFAPAVEEVVEGLVGGNALGREDEAGLPRVGDGTTSLTWMDVRVGGAPVTPRAGCPVEVAALWVHARRCHAEWKARRRGRAAARPLAQAAQRSAASFLERFWLPRWGYLADAWHDGRQDATIRPNMVLAAALEGTPLARAQLVTVVAAAEAELLTPRGLRTLEPGNPAYHPRYEGGVEARDRAYHQGTVWPWLVGSFVEASLAAHGRGRAVVERLRALLDGMGPATQEMGLGHLAEVYDADPPHRPGGCFAQAWSDAEVLRAYALLAEAQR